jgi:hypothetical protein
MIDDILTSIFYTDPWADASEEEQTKAITKSTLDIERLNFVGCKTDADQDRQWPRNGDTDVPFDYYRAIVENAIAILDGVDAEMETRNINLVSQNYGSVRSSHRQNILMEHFMAGICSATAWRLLVPFLRDVSIVKVQRV